jgi:hypothetical protein
MDELSELAGEKRRAYKRDWARKNREKCNQYVKNYWLKKAAQELKGREPGESQ